MISPTKSRDRQLATFGALTAAFLVLLSAAYASSRDSNILTLLMLTPAASVLVSCLVAGDGIRQLPLAPRLRGNLPWYAAAWLLPALAAFAGAALYFLVFPRDFDPLGSQLAEASGVEGMGDYISTVVPSVLAAVLVNPIPGLLPCLGEELAWRGYLLPALSERMPRARAALATGVAWGVWHAPIVAMGYNYGAGHPVAGVLAMTAFCAVMGCISGFLFFRTRTVWAPVAFHAAVNGIAMYAPSALLMRAGAHPDPFIGPDLTGIIGGAGFVVLAVICFAALRRMRTGAEN